MKRHVEKVNSSFKVGDVSVEIKIIDMTKTNPKLLGYSLTKQEREMTKKAA